MISTDTKEELKQKFYTDLTALELQNQLNLTNAQYNQLLIEVKHELGLPSKFKRKPSKFPKYASNKYYILTTKENVDEILTYAPTLKYAYNYIEKNNINQDSIIIDKANDENMKYLIEKAYFENNEKWDTIMLRLKMPYQDFYRLLNQLKAEKGVMGNRTSSNQRYIYEYTKKKLWKIRKTINGETKDYGAYTDLNLAIKVRDYLESINWSVKKWEQNKTKILEDL